jgi:Family of unknown function (DUF5719)
MMRRFGLLGAVVLVLGVVYLVAWRTQPGTSAGTGQQAQQTAAVTSISRSCPPSPNTGAAHIAMIALPSRAAASAGTVRAGSATLSAVPTTPGTTTSDKGASNKGAGTKTATTASQPVTVSAPGALTTVTAPGAPSGTGPAGTAVAASGQMAEGFEAEQTDASGMGLVTCAHASSDMWFVGTGAADGASSITLYLMNTGDLAASVNVTILTDAGLQSGLSTGITVAPHQSLTQPIASLVHGSAAVALHVQTSSGQVAASVWEDGGSGGAWLPQAAAPATSLVIPGLTVASSAARLFVTVPGSSDARLTVTAFTAQGKFVQFGSTPVDAPAAATSSFSLNSLGASAAGLKLTSNVPIVAAVQVSGQGIGSFTTAVPPLTEQGVVAGNPATRGLTVGLVLTAPAGAAHATVTVIGAAGSGSGTAGTPQAVTVPAGRTEAVAVSRPQDSRQPFAIVITPGAGSGPLYAARVVTAGSGGLSAALDSLLPVPNALTVISLPPVQDAYPAILP